MTFNITDVTDSTIRNAHDAHKVSIDTVNAAIKETKEDIGKLIELVTVLTDPAPSTILVRVGELKFEDYKKTKYWFKAVWIDINNKRTDKHLGSESPVISLFIEDQEGNGVSEAIKERIRGDLSGHWWGMYLAGRNPDNWTKMSLEEKEIFRAKFEKLYPILRLCEAGWKVDYLWINYFTSWRRQLTKHLRELEANKKRPELIKAPSLNTKNSVSPAPSPEDDRHFPPTTPAPDHEQPPAASSPIPIPISSDTGATTGSKRGRDEDEPHTASDPKRWKGKGRAIDLMSPTQFRNPAARMTLETCATVTKVRLSF